MRCLQNNAKYIVVILCQCLRTREPKIHLLTSKGLGQLKGLTRVWGMKDLDTVWYSNTPAGTLQEFSRPIKNKRKQHDRKIGLPNCSAMFLWRRKKASKTRSMDQYSPSLVASSRFGKFELPRLSQRQGAKGPRWCCRNHFCKLHEDMWCLSDP